MTVRDENLSDKPRNVRRRIARLEAKLKARGLRARTLRTLLPLGLKLREEALRSALMMLNS